MLKAQSRDLIHGKHAKGTLGWYENHEKYVKLLAEFAIMPIPIATNPVDIAIRLVQKNAAEAVIKYFGRFILACSALAEEGAPCPTAKDVFESEEVMVELGGPVVASGVIRHKPKGGDGIGKAIQSATHK